MAPVEVDVITPREAVSARLVSLKVVDKVMELPIVNDAVNEVTKFSETLTPVVETVKQGVDKIAPYVETIKSKAAENSNENINATLVSTKEKVVSVLSDLDEKACIGLDSLVTKVPALKDNTPDLMENIKESSCTYASMATEYVASFGIVQIALKIGDKGLQLAEDALDMAGVGKSKLMEPVKRGIHKIRRDARVIRRAGAKLAHPKPAKTIGEASLLGAMAELFCVNFFLSAIGLQLVPAYNDASFKQSTSDLIEEDETTDVLLSEEKLADYNPAEDPDFVPDDVPSGSEDGSNDEEEAEGDEKTIEHNVSQGQPEVNEVYDDDVCDDEREDKKSEITDEDYKVEECTEESEAERLGEVVDESLE